MMNVQIPTKAFLLLHWPTTEIYSKRVYANYITVHSSGSGYIIPDYG